MPKLLFDKYLLSYTLSQKMKGHATSFDEVQRILFLSFVIKRSSQSSNLWIIKPDLNFGSNQVVLGGIILPLSAIFIICFIETG